MTNSPSSNAFQQATETSPQSSTDEERRPLSQYMSTNETLDDDAWTIFDSANEDSCGNITQPHLNLSVLKRIKHFLADDESPETTADFLDGETNAVPPLPLLRVDYPFYDGGTNIFSPTASPVASEVDASAQKTSDLFNERQEFNVPFANATASQLQETRNQKSKKNQPLVKNDENNLNGSDSTQKMQEVASFRAEQHVDAFEINANQTVDASEINANQTVDASEINAIQTVDASEINANQTVDASEINANQTVDASEINANQTVDADAKICCEFEKKLLCAPSRSNAPSTFLIDFTETLENTTQPASATDSNDQENPQKLELQTEKKETPIQETTRADCSPKQSANTESTTENAQISQPPNDVQNETAPKIIQQKSKISQEIKTSAPFDFDEMEKTDSFVEIEEIDNVAKSANVNEVDKVAESSTFVNDAEVAKTRKIAEVSTIENIENTENATKTEILEKIEDFAKIERLGNEANTSDVPTSKNSAILAKKQEFLTPETNLTPAPRARKFGRLADGQTTILRGFVNLVSQRERSRCEASENSTLNNATSNLNNATSKSAKPYPAFQTPQTVKFSNGLSNSLDASTVVISNNVSDRQFLTDEDDNAFETNAKKRLGATVAFVVAPTFSDVENVFSTETSETTFAPPANFS